MILVVALIMFTLCGIILISPRCDPFNMHEVHSIYPSICDKIISFFAVNEHSPKKYSFLFMEKHFHLKSAVDTFKSYNILPHPLNIVS